MDKINSIKENALLNYEKYQKKSNLISFIRGMVFISFIIFMILFVTLYSYLLLILAVLLLIAFIVCLIIHNKIDISKNYYHNVIVVCEEYIMRIEDKWKGNLKPTGLEFSDFKEDFIDDIDIIGKNSLFTYLCIAKSRLGKKKLFLYLQNKEVSKEEVIKRQGIIQELAQNFDMSIDIQAKMRLNEKIESINHIEISGNIKKSFFTIGLIISFLTVVFLILGIFKVVPLFSFVVFILFQVLLTIYYTSNQANLLSIITGYNEEIETLHSTLTIISNYDFINNDLKNITNNVARSLPSLNKLRHLYQLDSFRYNVFSLILANSFFPFSIMISGNIYDMLEKNEKDINSSIDDFFEIEALLSLSVIGQTRTKVSMPIFSKKPLIIARSIYHPLLEQKKVIANNFETADNINIITGSNMSGKTSFMRTIAINQILMTAGTFVCAEHYESTYMKIFTSMRIADNLSEGVSTFYCEILKIKKAIDYLQEGKPMISFIDEVFRGTNSNDRIEGAKHLLKKLSKPNSIVLCTTHDFELCHIDISNLKNYHFTEYYENDKIKFDYKIKNGMCTTTNANYLLRLVKIID